MKLVTSPVSTIISTISYYTSFASFYPPASSVSILQLPSHYSHHYSHYICLPYQHPYVRVGILLRIILFLIFLITFQSYGMLLASKKFFNLIQLNIYLFRPIIFVCISFCLFTRLPSSEAIFCIRLCRVINGNSSLVKRIRKPYSVRKYFHANPKST